MHATTDQDVIFTQVWWKGVCNDESRLIAWLRKLYATELGGYFDYQAIIDRFEPDTRTKTILINVAEDEKRHAGLICNLLEARGYSVESSTPSSEYWKTMNSHITDLKTACAANYYGEALASFRFAVILGMACTPPDVRELIATVLPDEQFHELTLKRLAGKEALAKFESIHKDAVSALKKHG